MPSNENLCSLIDSMTKAEKRLFKLDIKSQPASGGPKYARLFDSIVKCGALDEKKLIQSGIVSSTQLPNMKAALYSHLLATLRSNFLQAEPEMQVRTLVDNADLLFDRGLYDQSRKMLKKAIKLGERLKMPQVHHEVLRRERILELHLTQSITVTEARETRIKAEKSAIHQSRIAAFSGLILELHAYYIQNGHVSNVAEFETLRNYCESQLPQFDLTELNLYEKIYFYRARTWFYFVNQDFPMCYRYFSQAIALMEKEDLIYSRPILYLKLYNGSLNAFLHMNKRHRFNEQFERFKALLENKRFQSRRGVRHMLERYVLHHQINKCFLFGEFKKGALQIPDQLNSLSNPTIPLEPRYLTSTLYKMACIYFGNEQYEESKQLLDRIIYFEDNTFRKDIHKFARILKLACLFELKDLDQLFSQLVPTYNYLWRNQDMNLFQKEILRFLRVIANSKPENTKKEFSILRDRMINISRMPFEKKPFFYFDIISWLESNIQDEPVAKIIQKRGLGHGGAVT
jgi:hypothetical protein